MAVDRGNHHTLDEISLKIGELAAYTHEHRHGVNNLSAKFDGLAIDIAKRVEALDTKITIRIDEVVRSLTHENFILAQRVEALEVEKHQRDGAISLVTWLSRHWPFAALLTALATLIAWVNGKLGP